MNNLKNELAVSEILKPCMAKGEKPQKLTPQQMKRIFDNYLYRKKPVPLWIFKKEFRGRFMKELRNERYLLYS